MKCYTCENTINKNTEYIKIDWFNTGEYVYFCDWECLMTFIRMVVEYGGGE